MLAGCWPPHQVLEQSVDGIDGAPRGAHHPRLQVMAEALNAFFSAHALQKIPWIAERVVRKMKLFTLKKMVYRGWADLSHSRSI